MICATNNQVIKVADECVRTVSFRKPETSTRLMKPQKIRAPAQQNANMRYRPARNTSAAAASPRLDSVSATSLRMAWASPRLL
jgi:hypothetical protein